MLRLCTLAVAVLAFTATSLPSSIVMAHEEREVGKYKFVVGWAVEPTAVDSPNSLFLEIRDKDTGEGTPDLEETLEAEIIAGGGAQTKPLPLTGSDEEPGVYGSPIVPTRAGDYTFRIFGTIGDQEVDESFSSGPETFDSIEDVSEVQFPDKVPSNADLAEQVAGLDTGGSSDTATILAIVGIVVGAVAIGVGGYALASRRSA